MFLKLESKCVLYIQLSFFSSSTKFCLLTTSLQPLPCHFCASASHCNYIATILFSNYLLLSYLCSASESQLLSFTFYLCAYLAFMLTFRHGNFFIIPLFYTISFYSAFRSHKVFTTLINIHLHQETRYYTFTVFMLKG